MHSLTTHTQRRYLLLSLPCLLLPTCPILAQQEPHAEEDKPAASTKKDEQQAGEIQPYDEVITEDATTSAGLFYVHRLDEKVFYELPTATLGRDMLWVTQIEATRSGNSLPGMPVRDRVVRWELRDEDILLRDVVYRVRAEGDDSIQLAVRRASLAPIIRVFPVKAWGKDKRPVIDVTELFTTDVAEFSAKDRLNAGALDAKRTFIEQIKAFPKNIETQVLATYSPGGTADDESDASNRNASASSGVTALVHHSMLRLPERPMKPRRFDERVGFFTVGFEDYGDDQRHQVENVRYITRWRLEKKDPQAELSEPVKPIVFYVAREVPEKWKPWCKKGIEMWQPAFEQAGFKNAIRGKLAPSEREEPDWDPEDARVSTIRWLPSTIENAFGPHVHDPRTGEILEADVRMYHNVMKLCRDWYFVQASPSDSRARKLPLPDEVMGELLAYVVAHEVGHSLGFPHNMKASSSFTVAQLRDPEFTKRNGTEASIMDYGRFNYVAQPGDGAALIPKVGPYDHFAVEWGYRQYENADAEQTGLRELVSRQIDNPVLRFGGANPSLDPSRQTEDLGSDPIAATELGLKNISRVAGYLVEATCEEDKDYSLLRNMYDELLAQRNRELGHVAAMVGGFVQNNLRYGDARRVYEPVPSDRQRAAVAFLIQHALETPADFVDPAITLRLEASGAARRIAQAQTSLLRRLIDEDRVLRMQEHVARGGGREVYVPSEMLGDLRRGIWRELAEEPMTIDLYRRNLQRAHVRVLTELVESRGQSDLAALARAELESIREAIEKLHEADLDRTLRAHVRHTKAWIQETLAPHRDREN